LDGARANRVIIAGAVRFPRSFVAPLERRHLSAGAFVTA
jgi:hypothetical protein